MDFFSGDFMIYSVINRFVDKRSFISFLVEKEKVGVVLFFRVRFLLFLF